MATEVVMTDSERAYAAGLFDGEGSIQLAYGRGGRKGTSAHVALAISITNTDFTVLRWVQERWGGYIYTRPAAPRHRVTGRWQAASRIAARFLADVEPYLIIKRAHAANALAFQATKRRGRNAGLTPDEWATIERYVQQSHLLNARGVRE